VPLPAARLPLRADALRAGGRGTTGYRLDPRPREAAESRLTHGGCSTVSSLHAAFCRADDAQPRWSRTMDPEGAAAGESIL
jgi:hypothetical protein